MSTVTSNQQLKQESIPSIPSGQDILRRYFFKPFVREHAEALTYLYNTILTKEQQDCCTLDEWITFAFESTSTNGLQTYK